RGALLLGEDLITPRDLNQGYAALCLLVFLGEAPEEHGHLGRVRPVQDLDQRGEADRRVAREEQGFEDLLRCRHQASPSSPASAGDPASTPTGAPSSYSGSGAPGASPHSIQIGPKSDSWVAAIAPCFSNSRRPRKAVIFSSRLTNDSSSSSKRTL